MMKTTPAPAAIELPNLCAFPTVNALPRAAAFLAELVRDRSFLQSQVLPLLEEAHSAERWYVARRWDAPDKSFSLQVFVWPPGTRTMIHDHSSWGAYACAAGTVLEERYERLDDGSRHEHARLREVWQLPWSPRDGASTVFPATGASTGRESVRGGRRLGAPVRAADGRGGRPRLRSLARLRLRPAGGLDRGDRRDRGQSMASLWIVWIFDSLFGAIFQI